MIIYIHDDDDDEKWILMRWWYDGSIQLQLLYYYKNIYILSLTFIRFRFRKDIKKMRIIREISDKVNIQKKTQWNVSNYILDEKSKNLIKWCGKWWWWTLTKS